MDSSELTALASELGREGFIARFPHLFLVFHEAKDGIVPVQFSTQIIHRRDALKKPIGVMRVMPLVKAAGNPYSDRISIGRARNCDVVLRDPSVSKLHAHVRREPNGTWVIIDLDSHNGTAVSGVPILASRPEPIHSGDLLTFGGVTVQVFDSQHLYSMISRSA